MTNPEQSNESRYMQRVWVTLFGVVSLVLPPSVLAATPSQSDLDAILRTREMALAALNTRDFSKIAPYLHPNFTITTVDNQIFHNAQEFETYWNQQLSGPVKRIDMELTGDTTRTFLSSETEVAHGAAISTFHFTDGNVATMPLRWTAVLQKSQSKWMIQTLHFSANLLDNPVLSGAQTLTRTVGIVTGISGLLLGAIGMRLIRRRRQGETEAQG